MGAGGETGGHQAGLTAGLARFLADARWDEVPASLQHESKRAILNWLGCAIAGRSDPSIGLLQGTFPESDAMNAALLNAAASTAFDFDDTHLPTVIHPSPPVAAAAFSVAKDRKLSGKDLLHAYLLGVEVACRIGNAVSPGHYQRGWHITSTCGVFGATAAAGKLLGLNEKQFVNALGIAATQAAGLVEVLGSMARVLNAGFAARNGVAAALLAEKGFGGPERPIEGARGFVNVFGGDKDLSKITEGLGSEWELPKVVYKPYPCGVVVHALIDAVLSLRDEQEVTKIVVALHPLAIERTDRPNPRNSIEGRLSAQHCVAVALLHGTAGVAQFSDAAVMQTAPMRKKVSIVADPSLDKAAATVSVHTREGVRTAHREPRIEMSDAELEAKFRSLGGADAERLMRLVDSLDTLDPVSLP